MAGGTGTGGFAVPPAAPAVPAPQAAPPAAGGRGGTGNGGFGAPPAPGTAVAPAKGGGKGLFGSIASDLGAAGHWVASKASLASRDIKQMPGGILSQAEAGANDYMLPHLPFVGGINVGGDQGVSVGVDPTAPHMQPMIKGMIVGAAHTLRHPLADPFMTALTVMPFAHGAGRVGLAADDAVSAARAGDGGVLKALVSKPKLLTTPRLINEPGREAVSLYSSHNAARRLVQAGIDKAVNKALANDQAKGMLGHEGPVARYGSARMRGTVAERARTAIRYQQSMIATTRLAARGVSKFAKSIKADVENPALTAQALLHSLHDNVMPEDQAILHEQQAAQGVNPEQNKAWAQAFNDAAKLDVVKLGDDNRVTIDPAHPLVGPLARADHALESIGSYTENQLITRGLRDPADLADRRGRVAQLVARGKPLMEKPQSLEEAEKALERAQSRHEANLQADEKFHAGEGPKTVAGYRVPQGPKQTLGGVEVPENAPLQSTVRDRTVLSGQKLEDAKARVQSLQDRYGFSSPARREAQVVGIQAREQISEAGHRLFGEHAPQHLAQIESFARQWARLNDKTPHEFYAQFLRHTDTPAAVPEELTGEGHAEAPTEHAAPDTLLHEAIHAVRQSLSPTMLELVRRMYAPDGWTREAEEAYVTDMMKASRGEPVPPKVQRLFLQTHEYTPGRGYIPMTKWEDAKQPSSPMASASGQIVGLAKDPLNKNVATGTNLLEGNRRTDVAEAVTSHASKLFRYFNTLDTRELSLKHGSDERMSSRDRLVREDRRTEAGFKLPAGRVDEALKETLGLLENKTGLPAPEEEGLSAGVSAVLTDLVGNLFPGHFAPHTEITLEDGAKTTAGEYEAKAARGAKAPAGYKWVPEDIVRLKDLESTLARGESSKVGRFADNVNGSITAATVYYKVGHFFTRYFTNASANIMQGSAAPWQIARSVSLWHDLSDAEISQALSYAGTHYSEAAPGATGGTAIGRSMQKGIHVPFTDVSWRTKSGVGVMSPQFWATHVDAPFRFNSIAFEARQAGYVGTEGFRQFLNEVHDYGSLDAHGRAQVDGVLRRADREAIAYDRLNQFEKKYLSRAIWFYPWVKGSTVFTANAMLEHPFKSAYLGSLGQEQKKRSDAVFGDEPSYEGGLTALTGGSNPLATDMNTFNPFSTAADLLQLPSHEEEAAGMFNPGLGYADESLHSQDSHGSHVPHPWASNLKDLISSTPEAQIALSKLDHGDQSHRLFPGGHGRNPLYKNWLGELVRSFASPAAPRHVNPDAGHSLAERERKGR